MSQTCVIAVTDILPAGTYTVVGTPLTDGVDDYAITGSFIVALPDCLYLNGGMLTYSVLSLDSATILTVSVNFRPENDTDVMRLVGSGTSWYLALDEGRPALYVTGDGTPATAEYERANASIVDGDHHVITASYNGGTGITTISVDGTPVGSTTIDDNNPPTPHQSASELVVGSADDPVIGCINAIVISTGDGEIFNAPLQTDTTDTIADEDGEPSGAVRLPGVEYLQFDNGDYFQFDDGSYLELESD